MRGRWCDAPYRKTPPPVSSKPDTRRQIRAAGPTPCHATHWSSPRDDRSGAAAATMPPRRCTARCCSVRTAFSLRHHRRGARLDRLRAAQCHARPGRRQRPRAEQHHDPPVRRRRPVPVRAGRLPSSAACPRRRRNGSPRPCRRRWRLQRSRRPRASSQPPRRPEGDMLLARPRRATRKRSTRRVKRRLRARWEFQPRPSRPRPSPTRRRRRDAAMRPLQGAVASMTVETAQPLNSTTCSH